MYFLMQAFLCLQGVAEPTRYKYLSEVVASQTSLKELSAILKKEKQMSPIKNELMRQLKTSSWEETVQLFPCHATDAVLEPYRGTLLRTIN